MKKLWKFATLTPIALFSFSALADDNSNAFSGFYVGGELSSTKQEFSVPYSELRISNLSGDFTADGSRGNRLGIIAGYGFDYGSNFIGLAEAKLTLSNVKTKNLRGDVTKEKLSTSLAYLQGYRIADKFLPYVKVSFDSSTFDINNDAVYPRNGVEITNEGAWGFGFGAGVRYAVTPDFNLGAGYHKVTLKGKNDIEIKTNTISLIGTYRF